MLLLRYPYKVMLLRTLSVDKLTLGRVSDFKAAADDQRNHSNISKLNANNTNCILLTSCCALSFSSI